MITEKDIQKFIWEHKDDFAELLIEPTFPIIEDKKPWEYSPSELLYYQTIRRYQKIWESIVGHWFFGCEVPLKRDGDSTIRADFLGVLEGCNGIVITELKKSTQTERQAYIELLAYGSHVRALFAPMSKMDVVYLLIAPMQERIVREATISTLLYDKNDVCALIPTWEGENISTLKLSLWIPSYKEFENLTGACFSESNFDVFKVAWDGLPGEWSPEHKGENPDEYMIERLNKVSSLAAQIMEARGIHGFVFASQAWSELIDTGHLINSIVIGGINPYKATKNRVLIEKYGFSPKEANNTPIDYVNMLDVIAELRNSALDENEKVNFLSDLSITWSNEITGIGFEVVKLLTTSSKRDSIQTSYGSFDWATYQCISMEDIYCHNYEMTLTGIIRELFYDYSIKDWKYIKENGYNEHPIYSHGDIPSDLVDIVGSQFYSRDFLKRLFSPYYEEDTELEEEFE